VEVKPFMDLAGLDEPLTTAITQA